MTSIGWAIGFTPSISIATIRPMKMPATADTTPIFPQVPGAPSGVAVSGFPPEHDVRRSAGDRRGREQSEFHQPFTNSSIWSASVRSSITPKWRYESSPPGPVEEREGDTP